MAFSLVGGGALSIVLFLVELRRSGVQRAYRIARFDDDNGFRFSQLKNSAGYSGMLFTHGVGYHRWMIVSGDFAGRSVEFGNLAYTEIHGRRNQCQLGYIAMRMPARLPKMVITKRENPIFASTLVQYPHKSNRVDVGQGRAFRLYVPAGAESVAESLSTPETVALFSRLARRYSIEIVGDMIFLTRSRRVSRASARLWRRQLGDVTQLARALNASEVWQFMSNQPKRFLQRTRVS